MGRLAAFAGMDIPTSSTINRELVGWKPTYPGLLDDLENAGYF